MDGGTYTLIFRRCANNAFSRAAVLAEAAPGLVAAIAIEMKESSRLMI